MTDNPHKSAFGRWRREANKHGGSPIGEAILAYLENERPVHPLDENYNRISTVPLPPALNIKETK